MCRYENWKFCIGDSGLIKVNIFKILGSLYTDISCKWLNDINENEVQPFVIQRWLVMNDKLRVQTRWLDKYVYVLSPKMYLSLAWSIIPKVKKVPFVKYIKKVEEVEEYDFILDKVRKQYKLADNDFGILKDRLIISIKKDMINWFSYYGVPKKYWKKYMIDFRKIKEFGKKISKPQKGLGAWGM